MTTPQHTGGVGGGGSSDLDTLINIEGLSGSEFDDILIGNWQDAAVWLRQELANTRETLKKERDEWANERKALRERIDDLETELAQEKATRQKESAELRKMLVNLQGT